ncbi:hypothetical protein HG536_0D01880 [Torulaspora globosa]|uniref:Uncharacterized protein n=1 Tax=Torulaspora globosa TaxID=48254 RepID=A0A7G3ZGN0_9SACH|nr:uncharacterized protein HG536_0D01880 [Torulaspora globosa]QLL32666.1 hypothetical protein HG536_0D01880 [Torulaspora globosa]
MTEAVRTSLRREPLASEDPFVSYLVNTKVSENLNILRTKVINEQLCPLNGQKRANSIEQFQDGYPAIAFQCLQRQHLMLTQMTDEYRRAQHEVKTRRYSVDFDSPRSETDLASISDQASNEGGIEQIGSTAELRRRLLGKRANENSALESEKSAERQLEDQDNLQNGLIEDMTKLVGSLKQGAVAFHNALNEDKAVFSAAEIGIQTASTSLTDISGKLRKYDKKKLGYIFYITVFLALFFGLIVTFIIIQLFPAL